MAPPAARWVASPTRTVDGGATLWSRLAVLTMSPATIPWSVAPRVTAASPVRIPTRTSMPGAQAPHGADEVEARPDRPLGVVLVGDRGAPQGHDRVADELLDGAAVAADDLADGLEVAVLELADLLGVAPLGERREPDEIGEQDADEAALGDGVGLGGVVGGRCAAAAGVAVVGAGPRRRPAAWRTRSRTWPPAGSSPRSSGR